MAWKANLTMSPEFMGHQLRAAREIGEGNLHVVTNMTFEKLGPSTSSDPILHGPDATAFVQAIMDAGYGAGLRPSFDQLPSLMESHERDLRAHLEDMRKISGHLLKIRDFGP